MQNNELAMVKQKLLTLLPKFSVIVEDEEIAEITKELTLFRPCYKVKGPGWTVDGAEAGNALALTLDSVTADTAVTAAFLRTKRSAHKVSHRVHHSHARRRMIRQLHHRRTV